MISLVIPVYNEAPSLPELFAQIAVVAKTLTETVEVLFIDDGSSDQSWPTIQQLAQSDARVRGIRLRRNFGKAAALQAGFSSLHGNIVFTLDADLQDDPEEIPNFLAKLAEGLDVVSGWKKVRHDPIYKVFPSRVFNSLVSRVSGVRLHDHNCGFKVYRAAVLAEVKLYGELHRFVPVLAASKGFRVGELIVRHRARKFGQSKFGWRRFIKGLLDLMSVRFTSEFGHRPLHLLGAIALLIGGGVVLLAALAGLAWVVDWYTACVVSGFLSGLLAVIGTQAFLVGLLAELFVAKQADHATPYAIAETTE